MSLISGVEDLGAPLSSNDVATKIVNGFSHCPRLLTERLNNEIHSGEGADWEQYATKVEYILSCYRSSLHPF